MFSFYRSADVKRLGTTGVAYMYFYAHHKQNKHVHIDLILGSSSYCGSRLPLVLNVYGIFVIHRIHCIPDFRILFFYSSDGRAVRASASGAVDSALIPSRIKPMT